MALLWHAVILMAMTKICTSMCPADCSCMLDGRGRNTVLCKNGGMVGPLILTNMSADTEVLNIGAPDDNSNQLTMSPIFSSYRNLEEIHITRSNIPQLGQHFFWGLSKLDILNLSLNNITQPLDHNFRGLMHLKELYLDDNRIHSLPSGTFRYLQELKLLSIQRNRITELMPRIFQDIRNLKILKLSGNNIGALNPEVFEDIQDLKWFECRVCGLESIPPSVFELIRYLTYLDIGDNFINHIAEETLHPLLNLKTLRVDGNRLTAITHFKLPSLRKLNLARNAIEVVSQPSFKSLHNLTDLDLSYNQITRIQFGALTPVTGTLEVLLLSGNRLSMDLLKSVLAGLEIRELHVAECSLISITESVFPETLLILNLAGNRLNALIGDIMPINLINIDLSSNRFRGLDEDVLMKLDNLKNLKLAHNPWSCDLCHIVPLLERVNRSAVIRNLRCHSPFTQTGKSLGSLSRSDLTWCTLPSYSNRTEFFLATDSATLGLLAVALSICFLTITGIAVFGTLLYSHRHAARYYTHEDKLNLDGDSLYNDEGRLFDNKCELSFQFPLNGNGRDNKMVIATINEITKEYENSSY